MARGIFLERIDLRILEGICYRQAVNNYQTILQTLGKPKDKKITVEEYAQYQMIDPQIVRDALKLTSK